MTTLTHLPSEIFLLILDQLDKTDLYTCTLINPSFYKAAMPLLWHQLYINSRNILTQIINAMTTSPHTPGTYVRSLQVCMMGISDTLLWALLRHVPLLTHLELSNADFITDTSFQPVARLCPQLRRLSLIRASITSASMMRLPATLHGLVLFRCPYLDDPTSFLSTLDTEVLTDLDITPFIHTAHQHTFAQALARFQHLTRLRLVANQRTPFIHTAHQHTFAQALARFQHRPRLRLVANQRVLNHDNDYTAFVTTAMTQGLTWPHLTHFCLDGCPTLDDRMLRPFLQAHKTLQWLEVSHSKITDTTLDAMATYLPLLRRVVVEFNPSLTVMGICRLVQHCAMLDNGVYFYGCGIHVTDPDFPKDTLDRRWYDIKKDHHGENHEVTWLAGDAFDDDEGGRVKSAQGHRRNNNKPPKTEHDATHPPL